MGKANPVSNAKRNIDSVNKQKVPAKGRSATYVQKSIHKCHVFANKNNVKEDKIDQQKSVSRSTSQYATLNDKESKRIPDASKSLKEQKKTFDINTFPKVFSTTDLMDKINTSSND